MAYSRWGISRWYTMWQTSNANKKSKEIFLVVGSPFSFTYGEIKNDIDDCVEKASAFEDQKAGKYSDKKVTDAEKQELKSYMREFLSDVSEKYSWEKLKK